MREMCRTEETIAVPVRLLVLADMLLSETKDALILAHVYADAQIRHYERDNAAVPAFLLQTAEVFESQSKRKLADARRIVGNALQDLVIAELDAELDVAPRQAQLQAQPPRAKPHLRVVRD
jgi:hypothetical protein